MKVFVHRAMRVVVTSAYHSASTYAIKDAKFKDECHRIQIRNRAVTRAFSVADVAHESMGSRWVVWWSLGVRGVGAKRARARETADLVD